MELPFSDIVNIIVVPWRIVLQTIDPRVNESLRETIHREEHLDEKILISHSNKFANQLQLREDKTKFDMFGMKTELSCFRWNISIIMKF